MSTDTYIGWSDGLSREQRMKVLAMIPAHPEKGWAIGWSIYRMPTTINPPTTLRLIKRDGLGRICQVISITENGITR